MFNIRGYLIPTNLFLLLFFHILIFLLLLLWIWLISKTLLDLLNISEMVNKTVGNSMKIDAALLLLLDQFTEIIDAQKN